MNNTIKRYRLARPGDEGREVFGSDCTIAKAIENAKARYAPNKIDGFYKDKALWETGCGCYASWKFAVVADEAPDPGEGYRLLKKMEYDGEEEEVREGDEYFENGSWNMSLSKTFANGRQAEGLHYRRRIEPEKPRQTSTPLQQNYKVQVRYGDTVAAEVITEKVDEISFNIMPIEKGDVTK